MYLIVVELYLLTYMSQGASYNDFGIKLDQCYATDADYV